MIKGYDILICIFSQLLKPKFGSICNFFQQWNNLGVRAMVAESKPRLTRNIFYHDFDDIIHRQLYQFSS